MGMNIKLPWKFVLKISCIIFCCVLATQCKITTYLFKNVKPIYVLYTPFIREGY